MTNPTNFRNRETIPNVGTRKSAPSTTNFSKGIKTYKPNDEMSFEEIYLAQDARFDHIGEYKTRHGYDKMCEPIGKTSVFDNYINPFYTSSFPSSGTSFTISQSGNLYSLTLKLKTADNDHYGVPQVYVKNADGDVIAESFANPENITDEFEDVEFIFNNAPSVEQGDVLMAFITLQEGGERAFAVGTVSNGSLMLKAHVAAPGHVSNVFEANIDGTKTILFTFIPDSGTPALYRMAADGTVSKIRDLPSGTKKVRFNQNLNKIRYADGKEGPRLVDPSGSWSDSAISTIDLKSDVNLNIKVSNIMDGTQDNLIYFNPEVDTQAVWTYPYGFNYAPEADYVTTDSIAEYNSYATSQPSNTLTRSHLTPSTNSVPARSLIVDANGNYAQTGGSAQSGSTFSATTVSHAATAINSYDKFSTNFYQSFPAIQTGDPITAMFNLGSVIYIMTRRNKYTLYYQDATVWTPGRSNAQNGTFSQESIVCDLNYAYFASDSGIFVFDGSSEASLTEQSIQNTYDAIKGKESIVIELFDNKLFVFYSSEGNGINDSCLVYNLNIGVWESFDTGTYVSAAIARQSPSNRFICGHSRLGMIMLAESQENAYDNLCGALKFDLNTAYHPYGTPSQLKTITKWRPEFATAKDPYTVACGYAMDFTDDVKYAFSVNLKNNAQVAKSYVWDNPSNYGLTITPTKMSFLPKVYGQFRRCQIRYQHHAAFEPVNFKSHTVTIQTQRIR